MRFDSCRSDVRRQWQAAVTQRAPHIPTVDATTTSLVVSSSSGESSSTGDHLPYHLLSIFTRLALSHRSFIDPAPLVRTLGVSNVEQQDAHEFRTYILQALELALLNSTYKPHHTLLQTLFEGSSKSVLRCQQCGHESTTASPFIDLTLPIKGRGSVYASMRSLCDVEQLEENAVYCSTCEAKTSMDKRVEYERLPPYLNVQLMRFELVFAGNGVRKKKIGDKIYIPEKIRMEGCLLKPTTVVEERDGAEKRVEELKEGGVKGEVVMKVECKREGQHVNGAGSRESSGRRRGAMKEEARDNIKDDMKQMKATMKAEVVKDEERISDETAMQDEQDGHNKQPVVKQGSGRGGGKGGRGKLLNGGTMIGGSEDSAVVGRGRGRGRGRGKRKGSIIETDTAADSSSRLHEANDHPHAHQNGQATVERVDLVSDDGDDNDPRLNHRTSGRLLRARGRNSKQPALLQEHADEQFESNSRAASQQRKREKEAKKEATELTENAHMRETNGNSQHTVHLPSPVKSDAPIAPSSPIVSVRDEEAGGAEVVETDMKLLHALDSVTAELNADDRQTAQTAADTAAVAATEVSDDAEDESLANRAAKNKAAAHTVAVNNAAVMKKRRKPSRIGAPRKRLKPQSAANNVTEEANDESQVVEVDEDEESEVKQQQQKSEKPNQKRGRNAAPAVNKADSNNSNNTITQTRPSKIKQSKLSHSASPPPTQPPPTADTTVPASLYSADEHASDYHLAAVLLHKGQYANHGHYTATLRDDSGCWWSFDDRLVTRLGRTFYNPRGEVVIDGKEGKREEEQQKEKEREMENGDGKEDRKDGVEEVNGDQSMAGKEKETKPDVQEADVEEIVESEVSQPPEKKKRGGDRRAKVQEQMQVEDGATAEVVADTQPAKRRSGRPKKETITSTAPTTEAVEDSRPVKTAKKAGKPKKAAVQKTTADASGVDAKTKKEAERMYGPGGFSKDAYMLLYCNKQHPALVKLKQEQERADAELHDSEQPPTFLTVASHPQLAKLLIKKYHSEEVERENAVYQAECDAYKQTRAVIEAEMDRRRAEVEEVAAVLQAQAIEADKATDEQLDTTLEERAEVLEQGKRTRFVSTQWLAKFLTGWTEPEKEKEKKADKKAKKKAAEKSGKAEKAEGKSENEAGLKEAVNSPIDISSDDDSSADNNTVATDEKQQWKDDEPTADEQADVDSKDDKIEADKQRDEKEDDPGAIVVDHDVHISAAGMEQAMKQAINQLDPGSLTESVDNIRCPHHRDKLNPHMMTAVKRVSVEAWERLVELDKKRSRKLLQETAARIEAVSVAGDMDVIPSSQSDEVEAELLAVPSMAVSDVCLACARSLFLGDLSRKRKVERVRQLLDSYHQYRHDHRNSSTPPSGSVWLSTAFIQRWKRHCQQVIASAKAAKDAAQQAELADKQRELDAVELGDAMEGVLCDHSELGTDRTARLWVSRKLWRDITAMASEVQPAMFDVGADECPTCTQEEEQDNEEAKQHKAAMKDERAALRNWASKSHRFPDPTASPALLFKSDVIYLLPQSFQSDVYAFLHQRDPTDPPRPHFSSASLLCEHRLLKYVPRPEEGVIGQGGLHGTRLGVLVYCDEKVWGELQRYGYVGEDEPGVELRHSRIVGGGGMFVSEQWSSYELTSTPAVCEECVRRRQADEETGRTVFTKEDGGGIRVTTVATEEEAKSTTPLSSSSSAPSAPSAASPSPVLPTNIRPRRAAASRGSKQPVAIVELNCASSEPLYQLKMELLSQSYTAAWEPARQKWYWRGQLMDDNRTLADYGVVRGGEVKVWLDGDSEWDGTEAGRLEMWSEGKKGRSAAAERGFQGTALAMHARQHVQTAAVSQSVRVQAAQEPSKGSGVIVEKKVKGDSAADSAGSERAELGE